MSGAPKAKVLVLVPARWETWSPAQSAWISALMREIGSRWGAATVSDPGIPGESRGGMVFAQRGWRDFQEQCKEAIFEHPIEVVLAVGAAAHLTNLQQIAGWAPLVPRVSLLLEPDLLRLGQDALRSVFHLSDTVLFQGEWNHAPLKEASAGFARQPVEVCLHLERHYGLRRLPGEAVLPRGLTVLAGEGAPEGQSLRRLARPSRDPGEVLRVGAGAAAWNRALRAARFGHVLFLDGPVDLAPAGLARLREYFDMDVALGAVSPVRSPGRPSGRPDRLMAAHSLRGAGHREHGRFLEPSCWLARRDVMLQVGLLDDAFETYPFAVHDYSLRLRQAGHRLMTATDVLAFSPGRPAGSAADAARFRAKWCRGLTRALVGLMGTAS